MRFDRQVHPDTVCIPSSCTGSRAACMMHLQTGARGGRGKAGVCTCRDCSARSMYSMVSSRAQKAGTAPWRTMEEQDEGSTSARNVSARAANSIMSGLCSEFSRCTCTGAMPVLRDASSPALGMQKCLDAHACQISCSSLKVHHELLLYCLSI